MIMKHLCLFFYFVGTFIQQQMNFDMHFILKYDIINQCKILKKTDAVLLW